MSLFDEAFAAGAVPLLADQFGDAGRVVLLPREGDAHEVDAIIYAEERRQRSQGLDTSVVFERTILITSPLEQIKTTWQVTVDGTLYKIDALERTPAGWGVTLTRGELRQTVNPRHRSDT